MMLDGNRTNSASLSTLSLMATRPISKFADEINTNSTASVKMVADGNKSKSKASVKTGANEKKTNSMADDTKLTS